MAENPHSADIDPQAWASSASTAPLAVVWPLLGRHIAFHRRLVDLTADVKAALLLSQSIYWTRRGRDIAHTGGWFHKTAEQWTMETGLSPREQATAREVLRGLALVEEQRSGIPARLHFRLSVEELGARLSDRLAGQCQLAEWNDMVVVAELLGPSVAYHRTLAGIAGGVHAGLMLSRAVHLTRLQTQRRLDAWICNSATRWSEEIGLTRREQEAARRDLARAGLWEEALRGMPPSLMARIRLDDLLSLLADRPKTARHDTTRAADPVCGDATDRFSQKRVSRMLDPHILVSPKAPSLFRRNRHHCCAESAIPYMEHSTSDSVQPQNTAQPPRPPGAATSGGDLIFPHQLLPDESNAAAQLLRGCEDQAQALLDELAGRLQLGGVRSSPVAYLRGLIARAAAGTFVPELGPRIAAQRLQRHKEAVLRREREAEEERQAAERATPEYQAKVRARREEISQIAVEMRLRTNIRRQP